MNRACISLHGRAVYVRCSGYQFYIQISSERWKVCSHREESHWSYSPVKGQWHCYTKHYQPVFRYWCPSWRLEQSKRCTCWQSRRSEKLDNHQERSQFYQITEHSTQLQRISLLRLVWITWASLCLKTAVAISFITCVNYNSGKPKTKFWNGIPSLRPLIGIMFYAVFITFQGNSPSLRPIFGADTKHAHLKGFSLTIIWFQKCFRL